MGIQEYLTVKLLHRDPREMVLEGIGSRELRLRGTDQLAEFPALGGKQGFPGELADEGIGCGHAPAEHPGRVVGVGPREFTFSASSGSSRIHLRRAKRLADTFARSLGDGRFEIDNNLVENAMRPAKLGAKNWLFFGSKDAGHQAAVIYTLVENCKRHGVPVEAYLRDLLIRLPVTTDGESIAALTPARVAAVRSRKPAAA